MAVREPAEKAVWTVSEEIDNLASALVQAYESCTCCTSWARR